MNSLGPPLPAPPPPPPGQRLVRSVAVAAAAVAAGVIRWSAAKQHHAPFPFASMSLHLPAQMDKEPAKGTEFPSRHNFGDCEQQLAGIGLRKKNVLGLKTVVVYAFGVYVHASGVKDKLGGVEEGLLLESLACEDVGMSVRLSIVYGGLKMGSVRSAFKESVGNRILELGGGGEKNKELLDSFTSLFKDGVKLGKGTTIDITRLPGHVLRTTINNEEMGSIKSELLCRSVLDLYIGRDPFDKATREAVGKKVAAMLSFPE